MVTIGQILLHQIANPGAQTIPDRVADIEAQAESLAAHYAPGEPEDNSGVLADNELVETFLTTLKDSDPGEFDNLRRLPFAALLAHAQAG